MPKTLGQYLEFLQKNYPQEISVVSREIKPAEFEVTALLENLNTQKKFQAVLFNNTLNVHGQPSGVKLVSNLFGSRERCAIAMGMETNDYNLPVALEFARREKLSVPPEVITESIPVQEIVLTGDQVDVAVLPIVRHFELDMGPVFTMTCCMKDPDTGAYDVSFIKNFYKDRPDYMGVSIHSPHLERILQCYAELGQPAPIITILGHHPAFYMGVNATTSYESNDYENLGGFMEEPLRLAPSITWGDKFLVPADAEIIIEGEVLPGVREVVDPFGEVLRDYQPQCLRQAMQVKAITRRREAIMQDIFSGHKDLWVLSAIAKEGSLYNTLQSKVGNIVAVHRPPSGAGLATYISIKKKKEGQGKLTGLIAVNENPFIQVVVVVDDFVNVYNEDEVIWATLLMTNPQRDVEFLKNVGHTVFATEFSNNKVVIDATRPLDKPFPSVFRVPPKVLEAANPEDWID